MGLVVGKTSFMVGFDWVEATFPASIYHPCYPFVVLESSGLLHY